MLCKRPYRQGVAEFGCGQCIPCRVKRRRLWTIRLLLEARVHLVPSWFVTLTYSEEHVPQNGSVDPKHLQDFLKRIRYYARVPRVRFYGVGEYGDLTLRPHYHVVLYGLPIPMHNPDPSAVCQCIICKSWTFGVAHVGELTKESAAYTCKHFTKGRRVVRDGSVALPAGQKPRHPEFARMSRRPGIAADAVPVLSKALSGADGIRSIRSTGDVPTVVRHAKGLWPLGRYLRSKLRESLHVHPSASIHTSAGHSRRLQDQLRAPGGRDNREEKRTQDNRRAVVLEDIYNSKKGIGL